MEERLSAAGGELAATIRDGRAVVTLHRPTALNALTYGMVLGLGDWLESWREDDRVRTVVLRGSGTKAFCAGGDVKGLREGVTTKDPRSHDFFVREYELDFRIHTYPKPIVAMLDGIVMGGGMGISQGAGLRIVGPRTKMAMPETAIGLFPDVGGSFFLSRAPGELGAYLGLAGPTINATDAVYCGLADVDASPEPAAPTIEPLRAAIDRHFAFDRVEDIVASLQGAPEPEREWASKTLEALAKRSPTALKVTLRMLRRSKSMRLADCFRQELAAMFTCMETGDMLEGIRALLIDRDNAPRWSPATLEAVDAALVDRFFAPRWEAARHPLAHL